MIEWDEILEDIDWKRGAAIIILGLILIGLAVFLGLQMHKANTVRNLLENDQRGLQSFQDTWSGPGQKGIKELQKELKEEEDRLAATGVTLPESLDKDAILSRLKQLASSDRVQIVKLTPSERTDEYCLIYELGLVFSANDPRSAALFLSNLTRIPDPHSVKSQPVSIQGGTMEVTVDFYGFDLSAWNEINNCEVKLTMPNIPDREITGIYIFGGDLANLKAAVDQQKASLKDVKREFIEGCELQTELDKVRNKIKIVRQNIKK